MRPPREHRRRRGSIGMTQARTAQSDGWPGAAAKSEIARQVRSSSSSFYGAMRILPARQREAIFAVYAFCRAVDDIADDDGVSSAERRTALTQWRTEIEALFDGEPDSVIARALREPAARFGLAKEDFLAVIDGMEMDACGPIVAPDIARLELYCDRVASAVGRLCVRIFGEPGENGKAVARHLGRALQLTNILRDVEEDASIGRLYLPAELLRAHGIAFTRPRDVPAHANYPGLWRDVARRAHEAFDAAQAALGRCDRKKMRPARIMLEVYKRNLERMCALSDAELADPAVSKRLVPRAEKILIALRYGLI